MHTQELVLLLLLVSWCPGVLYMFIRPATPPLAVHCVFKLKLKNRILYAIEIEVSAAHISIGIDIVSVVVASDRFNPTGPENSTTRRCV